MGLLAIAALAVSGNWGLYIWAVNDGHVIEGSFGYFINPLVAVLFGVTILGERLRRLQWVAVSLGALAVLELTYSYGRPPWIALGLALTFAVYGLVKKIAAVPAVEALAIETTYLVPFALAYLLFIQVTGQAAFGHSSVANTLLLALVGVVTAVPLLAFGGSINRIPLSTVGLLQYITPVLQFLCGFLIFKEEMSPSRWVGFAIVWVALMVMSYDAIRTARDPNWVGGVRQRMVDELEEAPDYTG
jgi:chloramphenicol-sensitive protein RarD